MEFLVVRFPRSRRTLIDDEYNGRTNELIELEAGTHAIGLGPPANFTPESRKIVLRNTSALEPREVVFDEA